MPLRPPIACLKCGRAVLEGGSYHKECQPPQNVQRSERIQDQPYRALYNLRAWRDRTVPFILARDPICRMCHRAASTVVDHINDHKGDIQKFFNPNNLQGLCKPCHDIKTGKSSHVQTEPALVPNTSPIVSAHAPWLAPIPTSLPVAPEHRHLPDGQIAFKREYNRQYRKVGDFWVLVG